MVFLVTLELEATDLSALALALNDAKRALIARNVKAELDRVVGKRKRA